MNIMKKNTSPIPNVSMSIPDLEPLGPRCCLNLKLGIISSLFLIILLYFFYGAEATEEPEATEGRVIVAYTGK